VQIGAFAKRLEADQVRERMEQKYGAARLVFRDGDQMWRVMVGLEPSLDRANKIADQLDKEAGPVFVVRVDSE